MDPEKQWRVNFGAFFELNIEEASCQDSRRTRFSGIKSELL